MEYSRVVVERFDLAAWAAAVDERAPVSGRAGRVARGAAVELLVWPRDGRLARVRFRVFGCPHLVAAADLLAERLEGAPVEALGDCRAGELAAALDAPVEKLGRLLLLEDAAARCAAALTCDESC